MKAKIKISLVQEISIKRDGEAFKIIIKTDSDNAGKAEHFFDAKDKEEIINVLDENISINHI